MLAAEIVEDLLAALEQFAEIAKDIRGSKVMVGRNSHGW